MLAERYSVGSKIAGQAISGNYIVGEIVSILENTIVVKSGERSEVVLKSKISILYSE